MLQAGLNSSVVRGNRLGPSGSGLVHEWVALVGGVVSEYGADSKWERL
jgi:hypothetical protein